MSTKKEKVTLFVYDLSQGMARTLGPMIVGRPVEGVWHTSVCVFGNLYSRSFILNFDWYSTVLYLYWKRSLTDRKGILLFRWNLL